MIKKEIDFILTLTPHEGYSKHIEVDCFIEPWGREIYTKTEVSSKDYPLQMVVDSPEKVIYKDKVVTYPKFKAIVDQWKKVSRIPYDELNLFVNGKQSFFKEFKLQVRDYNYEMTFHYHLGMKINNELKILIDMIMEC